jgi:hypothetical protein
LFVLSKVVNTVPYWLVLPVFVVPVIEPIQKHPIIVPEKIPDCSGRTEKIGHFNRKNKTGWYKIFLKIMKKKKMNELVAPSSSSFFVYGGQSPCCFCFCSLLVFYFFGCHLSFSFCAFGFLWSLASLAFH